MINKELKRLSRRELVDIIYQLKKNEQRMQEEIESLKNELQDKRIRVSAAGSIADAAMAVTNVFSDAQMAADLYLREISLMKENAQKECAKKIEDAEKKVKEILEDGEKKLNALKSACKDENEKYQKLREQNTVLAVNKPELCEEVENG
ncbi:MAG: hypothetical protein IKT70_00160 [Clostridia bacterium]|nr:hypothetical protein [Clostridia bacterium]